MQIASFDELAKQGGKIVKYRYPHESEWTYARMYQRPLATLVRGQGPACLVDDEVASGVHVQASISKQQLEEGLIVELATAEEVVGKEFSFDYLRK